MDAPERIDNNSALPGRDTTTIYKPTTVEEAASYLRVLIIRTFGVDSEGELRGITVSVHVDRT